VHDLTRDGARSLEQLAAVLPRDDRLHEAGTIVAQLPPRAGLGSSCA
jgi:mevalonate kinase